MQTFCLKSLSFNVFLCLSTFFAVSLTGCTNSSSQNKLFKQQLFSFGTLIDINIVSDDEALVQQAMETLAQDFDRMHQDWHPWNPGQLNQINRLLESTQAFTPSAAMLELIKQASLLSEQTDGLFNPAIGRLIKLWQFDQLENPAYTFSLPSTARIQAILNQAPAMSNIHIKDHTVHCDNPAVALDFGAYAKGVALERAMETLKKLGISNALINAGGDLKVSGSNQGRPWRIGVRNPLTKLEQDNPDSQHPPVIAAITLADGESLFTSGDYERFFELKGNRYHHILDPRIGFPAGRSRAATVLTHDAAVADAAATAIFIAGPEKWLDIARQLQLRYAMLVGKDNTIYITSDLSERIHLLGDYKVIVQDL